MEGIIIEQSITVDRLHTLVSEWEHYHLMQLKDENVDIRIQAHNKRDEVERIIRDTGFMPCYVDNCLMLIVY